MSDIVYVLELDAGPAVDALDLAAAIGRRLQRTHEVHARARALDVVDRLAPSWRPLWTIGHGVHAAVLENA